MKDVAFTFENKYAVENDDLAAKVFMSMGGLETKSMVTQVRKLNKILLSTNYENLELKKHILEDKTHLSVPAAAISRGLRGVYA